MVHATTSQSDESVIVRLKGIRLERLRDFGDVWLALGLWRLLGLDTLLTEEMREGPHSGLFFGIRVVEDTRWLEAQERPRRRAAKPARRTGQNQEW